MPTENPVRFQPVSQDDPLAQPLLAELAEEYAARYEGDRARVLSWLQGYPAAEFGAPGGGMVVGLIGDRPVTGGAYRRFDWQTAELKRIWTDSRYRRRGLARALLAELEGRIALGGYRRIYLTTGDRQPEAEALYLSSGYARLKQPLPGEREAYPVAFLKVLPR